MSEYCSFCHKKIDHLLPFKCKFCGKIFCDKHRLPEKHNCEGLKKFKKDIGIKEQPYEEIFKPWDKMPNENIFKKIIRKIKEKFSNK